MSHDVITRLAAANPVPHDRPLQLPEPIRVRPGRAVLVLAVVAAVAVPATAFAGKLGDLLGISNGGTPVSASSVFPGESHLDQAMQELKVGGTMQYLGTLNGFAFYATRNTNGNFCFAIARVDGQFGKGFGCDLNADNFPSTDVKAITFPPAIMLNGVAADGVATVEALDADGNVLASTPVQDNLFASGTPLPPGMAAAIRTLDADGNVLSTQPLPGR
jgi:hypothetical protein